MDLALTEEQQQLLDVVTQLFGKYSDPAAVRAAEPLGFDEALWSRVSDMGLPSLGLSPAVGGSGATAVDMGLVCEAAGVHLAPVPLVDTMAALRVLERLTDPIAVGLGDIVASGAPVAIALHPAQDGIFELVPSGAVSPRVVGLDDDELVLIEGGAPPALGNLGRLPLAHRSARDGVRRTVLAKGAAARRAHGEGLDEWKALTSMALVGLARGALDLAVEYAKVREQFGVPIGTFQALAHLLADAATLTAGARLLALEACWAIDDDEHARTRLASMAFCNASEVAQGVAADGLHVHGGMGFSLEGDAQLFFRRATGWSQVCGGIDDELQLLSDVLYGPVGGS